MRKKKYFDDYDHYLKWMNYNWDISENTNKEIVSNGWVIERKINLNGESYRLLTEKEFRLKK